MTKSGIRFPSYLVLVTLIVPLFSALLTTAQSTGKELKILNQLGKELGRKEVHFDIELSGLKKREIIYTTGIYHPTSDLVYYIMQGSDGTSYHYSVQPAAITSVNIVQGQPSKLDLHVADSTRSRLKVINKRGGLIFSEQYRVYRMTLSDESQTKKVFSLFQRYLKRKK